MTLDTQRANDPNLKPFIAHLPAEYLPRQKPFDVAAFDDMVAVQDNAKACGIHIQRLGDRKFVIKHMDPSGRYLDTIWSEEDGAWEECLATHGVPYKIPSEYCYRTLRAATNEIRHILEHEPND